MDFVRKELEELSLKNISNGIIVVTNGVAWFKELPDFGGISLKLGTHAGKVTHIEEEAKKNYKL